MKLETRANLRKRKKRSLRRWVKFLMIIFLLFIAIGLSYAGYLAYTINEVANDSYKELDRGKTSELRAEAVTLENDPVTILLLGVDDYVKEDKGRSDAILLLTINPGTKEIALLSIPRDTRTYIPEIGEKNKINHAYAYNGIDATIETVQEMLDVPVDYYIKTGVNGFQDVVDELGGIEVEVPFDFTQVDLKNRKVYFEEGPMELDGREALAFVQMRKKDPEGDFGRQKRQQEALRAISEKALSINSLSKADDIIKTAGENVETNISLSELMGLRNFYKEIQNRNFTTLKLEGQDDKINGAYYFVPDEDSLFEIESELKRILEINSTDMEEKEYESEY
jgi:polyisoprenyl-teichoic acid--peptidoglycan teichoic acid transferase